MAATYRSGDDIMEQYYPPYVKAVDENIPPSANEIAGYTTSVFVLDKDGIIYDINELGMLLMGYKTKEELIGQNCNELWEAGVETMGCTPWSPEIMSNWMAWAFNCVDEVGIFTCAINLVTPIGMIYQATQMFRKLGDWYVCSLTIDDAVHHGWRGFTKIDPDGTVTNVNGYRFTINEMHLLKTWVDSDTDAEAANTLGIGERQLNRKLTVLAEGMGLKNKHDILRRLARVRVEQFPTAETCMPIMSNLPVRDALRLTHCNMECLPRLADYKYTLQEIARKMGVDTPQPNIAEARQRAHSLKNATQ